MRRALLPAAAVAAVLAASAVTKAVPGESVKSLLLGAGGAALLVAAPLYAVARLRFRGRAARATGTVLHCEEGGPGEPSCVLTVEFTDLSGERRTFTEEHAPQRAVGRRVPVLYDPDRPDRAGLDRHPVLDLVTTAAMFAIGAVLAYAAWGDRLSG
ncbi:DUF3592 domain-containing protein [Spirillospora sp. NPDC127200]